MIKKPAEYWREKSEIAKWIGKEGMVVVSTTIRSSSPELNYLTPYEYAIVDFGDQKKEFMAAAGEKLVAGDRVKLVLRKMFQPDSSSLIEYNLKLVKV